MQASNSSIVINVHDCHDFSVKPDVVEMEEHNVYFIQKLLDACQKGDVRSLVHLSSTFLQCTSLFPNVNDIFVIINICNFACKDLNDCVFTYYRCHFGIEVTSFLTIKTHTQLVAKYSLKYRKVISVFVDD
uniref:Uncharacterized protein n=1 Tax=Panagrolaimus sp. PS1159 TaxID=55785 RepID=A0AC35GQU6_9BILA